MGSRRFVLLVVMAVVAVVLQAAGVGISTRQALRPSARKVIVQLGGAIFHLLPAILWVICLNGLRMFRSASVLLPVGYLCTFGARISFIWIPDERWASLVSTPFLQSTLTYINRLNVFWNPSCCLSCLSYSCFDIDFLGNKGMRRTSVELASKSQAKKECKYRVSLSLRD
jgi:hypothetical protein